MDNRIIILDKALSLFAARGYDSVGVQEVASAAGITKPTLYHYFGSKSGLLEAILESRFPLFLKDLRLSAHYRHDLTVNLEETARTLVRFAEREPLFYRLLLALYFAPPESEGNTLSTRYLAELHDILRGLFLQAEADHGNMKGRSTLYAFSFLGLCHSLVGMLLNGQNNVDEKLVRSAVRQFQHGIYS